MKIATMLRAIMTTVTALDNQQMTQYQLLLLMVPTDNALPIAHHNGLPMACAMTHATMPRVTLTTVTVPEYHHQ